MVRDEKLGDARVVQDLDPFFAQIPLEPRACDVQALVQTAGKLNLPGCPFARLEPA
jgi:hypothetical protein